MIPHNPYVFVLLLVLAAITPVVSADAADIGIPPWVPYLLSVLNVAGAVVLKAMQPPGVEPPGSTVDALLPALEALTIEERAELSARLEWRAIKRGEHAP